MFSGDGGGALGGAGRGLAEGLSNMMKYKMEKAEAEKMAQQMAWAQNQNNPENKLRLAQADAFRNTKGTTFDGGLIDPKLKGIPIPVSELPQYLAKIAAGQGQGGNGVGRGMASLLRGVLNPQEQAKLDALPSAMAAHNRLVDILQAYNQASGNAGVATRLIQQKASSDPTYSSLAQSIGGDPTKLAAIYNSTARQLAAEQFKIVNGSNAAPPEDAIMHNMASYPVLGDSNQVAAEKLNTLIDTQIRPSMQGPIGRLEAFRDPTTGQFPVKLYGDVHQNLSDQLSGFGKQIHGLGDFKQDASGMMDTGLLSGQAPPQGASADPLAKHRALAQQIMGDPDSTPENKAWATKYYQPPAAAPAVQPPQAPAPTPVPVPAPGM